MDTWKQDPKICELVSAGLAKIVAREDEERAAIEKQHAENLALWAERTEEIRVALPDELRQYAEDLGNEDISPRDRSYGQTIIVKIPGLAPFKVELRFDPEKQAWQIGQKGSWAYSVAGVNDWDGKPKWDWRNNNHMLFNDLAIALAWAMKSREDFEERTARWDEWQRAHQMREEAERVKEAEYIPVQEDTRNGLIEELVQLIRDVAKEVVTNSDPG